MANYFFAVTNGSKAQFTSLFDFVTSTSLAMWNLRWQVSGYLGVVPTATEAQLLSRFEEGSNIHGVNLRRTCIEHTWNQQKESFAQIILVNVFAIYEGWLEQVLTELGKNTRANLRGQFLTSDIPILKTQIP